jgi:hypothetical protein
MNVEYCPGGEPPDEHPQDRRTCCRIDPSGSFPGATESYMRQLIKYMASHYVPEKVYLHLVYLWRFGRWANLRQPATLNEKLHWKKLHDYRPFHTTISDKYAVREWVAGRIGESYLIPLIAVLERVEDLDWTRLPDSCIIKATHASGQNVMVRGKHLLQETQVRNQLRRWMRQNHYYLSKEPQYRNITPRLIVEQLLTDPEGQIPMDFKFHCFHGRVETIQVDIDRFGDHRRNFYDANWKLLPFTWSAWGKNGPHWPNGRAVERPARLEEMIGVAQALAQEFDYIRVDLFNCRERVYFGELTLHHGGGWERFDPPGYDLYFGNKLNLREA